MDQKEKFVKELLAKDPLAARGEIVRAVRRHFDGAGISHEVIRTIRKTDHGITLGPGGAAMKNGKLIRPAAGGVARQPTNGIPRTARLEYLVTAIQKTLRKKGLDQITISADGKAQIRKSVIRDL